MRKTKSSQTGFLDACLTLLLIFMYKNNGFDLMKRNYILNDYKAS